MSALLWSRLTSWDKTITLRSRVKHDWGLGSVLLIIQHLSLLSRYDNYPTHCSNDFLDPKTNHCRIAKVEPGNRKGLGAASLNLTNIQEQDRGWYNCKVVLLNRQPEKENDVS